ncbi:hypothetical protein [Tianweitania sp.]|uniref:hypothetical protein n=1 Tax=Tianweitania sp. TaxID=2021634 RepID=UPI002898C570|nr:hypothetical protein [Tianweitania sp.]
MNKCLMALGAFLAFTLPAHTQPVLETGLAGALRGCTEWVLRPASWADGPKPFLAVMGLGNTVGLVKSVADESLPPPGLRAANHYWRINSQLDAGYVLVVSDQIPMCHITGGGEADLQPIVEAVLSSPEFVEQWEQVSKEGEGEMISTRFRSREEPKFILIVSRAKEAGGRQDRVQVLATAIYDVGQ